MLRNGLESPWIIGFKIEDLYTYRFYTSKVFRFRSLLLNVRNKKPLEVAVEKGGCSFPFSCFHVFRGSSIFGIGGTLVNNE